MFSHIVYYADVAIVTFCSPIYVTKVGASVYWWCAVDKNINKHGGAWQSVKLPATLGHTVVRKTVIFKVCHRPVMDACIYIALIIF